MPNLFYHPYLSGQIYPISQGNNALAPGPRMACGRMCRFDHGERFSLRQPDSRLSTGTIHPLLILFRAMLRLSTFLRKLDKPRSTQTLLVQSILVCFSPLEMSDPSIHRRWNRLGHVDYPNSVSKIWSSNLHRFGVLHCHSVHVCSSIRTEHGSVHCWTSPHGYWSRHLCPNRSNLHCRGCTRQSPGRDDVLLAR